MSSQESLRAAASRDEGFLGLDIIAMAHLIQQMNTASDAISGWLRTNAALPPGVPRTGLRQAAAVETWVNGQPGMLSRRRNYAVTHLGATGGHSMPRAGHPMPHSGGHLMPHSGGGLGRRRGTTPVGAGHHIGHFPDVRAAMRAGAADAAAVRKAGHIPPAVWKRLQADTDDPDYAHGLYERLGPTGTARLIKAALADKDHLKAVETSLGVASHQMLMDERLLRALLDEAAREGIRGDAVRVLARAGLDHRAKVALAHIGLTHLAAPPSPPDAPGTTGAHLFPAPNPPHAADHEAMIAPAAADPYAASELYARHQDTVHRALAGHPGSGPLTRLVAHATGAAT